MIYLVYYEKEEVLLNRIGPEALRQYSDLKDFFPLLQKRGTVVEVENSEEQMDSVYQFVHYLKEEVIGLSFSSLEQDDSKLQCPQFQFPISIPPPVWNQYQHLTKLKSKAPFSSYSIATSGNIIDTNLAQFFPKSIIRKMPWKRSLEASWVALKKSKLRLALYYLLRRKSRHYFSHEIVLSGVVYTTIISPSSSVGFLENLVKDFCSVFKKQAEATLVLKIKVGMTGKVKKGMIQILKRTSFASRVVVINEHLSQVKYEKLIDATSYFINTARDKIMPKSVLEFMSAGKPAISLLDEKTKLLHRENAFIIPPAKGSLLSFKEQFRQSYQLLKDAPQSYQMMSAAASISMKKYCSMAVIEPKVMEWLNQIEAAIVNES